MFQKSIVKKYLTTLDTKLINEKYAAFHSTFADHEKQQHIRESKEEQYQEGFLRDLFCSVLGYTINPEPNYNIITEKKNETADSAKTHDSRKADGAIIIEEKVKCVIELKGCDTTDLNKIEGQAFGYKAHNPGCRYVVISNFEKLRFYIDDASDFLEFHIFTLSKEDFVQLYLCLALEQIKSDTAAKLKSESVSEEKSITDKFYGDYSTFKRNLFEDIVENNGTQYDKLVLFKKTQKLLDRLLFILFCEDRGLLPENSILKTIDAWQQLKKLDAYQPLYERYKNYFNRMNTGYKSEDGTMDIFAYNGGLFKPDEILDNIKVGDDVLFIYSKLLAAYDFVSDVSVDILGHIFEHSLTEIEEIQNQILEDREERLDTRKQKLEDRGQILEDRRQILEDRRQILDSSDGGEENVKLSGFNCLEKGDGFNDGDLSSGQKTSKRGNLRALGSNETSGSVDSVEYSGGKFKKDTVGFSTICDNSTRFSDGIGNTTSNMPSSELHGTDRNAESTKSNDRSGKNAISSLEIPKPREAPLAPNTSPLASSISKRKKDGVFYTPSYITKYIVENTIGKLCEQKKSELEINETEYVYKCRKDKKEKLSQKLTEYRTWLMSLKICDPACGSGAFLNAALQFLKDEHSFIDELNAKMHGDTLIFQEIENSILENNLFGVDINEESVEIAKLSLWLHTAQKGRKLTTLNNNIKCGNSLFGDRHPSTCEAGVSIPKPLTSPARFKEIVPFNWAEEFPQVFEQGGFDVVIGNPPYVQLQSMGEMSDVYASCGYESYNKSADLYCLFAERGYSLLKDNGLQSFIIPNKWMLVDYGKELRRFMAKTSLQQILNFGDVQFFKDAATIVCIFVTKKAVEKNPVRVISLNQKTYHGDFLNEINKGLFELPPESFGESEWIIQSKSETDILKKMQNGTALKDLPIEINNGIKTGFNDAFYIDEKTKNQLIKEDSKSAELIKPLMRGRDITAWTTTVENQYLICTFPSLKLDIENYPAIKKHLLSFGKERLEQTGAKGARKKTSNKWFETQDTIAYFNEFEKSKIIYPEITAFSPFIYDTTKIVCNNKAFIITAKDNSISLKFLTAVFNSKLVKLWIWYNCPELLGGTREIRKAYFENLCIPVSDVSHEPIRVALSSLADKMLDLNKQLQKQLSNFTRLVENNLHIEKLSTALQNFYTLDFATFLKEVSKLKTTDGTKAKIALKDQTEWNEAFDTSKSTCQSLQSTIATTDSEINSLVYKLYGLTEDEIAVVDSQRRS